MSDIHVAIPIDRVSEDPDEITLAFFGDESHDLIDRLRTQGYVRDSAPPCFLSRRIGKHLYAGTISFSTRVRSRIIGELALATEGDEYGYLPNIIYHTVRGDFPTNPIA